METEDDCNDVVEQTGFCKDAVESDFGADEIDFGFEEIDFGSEEIDFGFAENDLNGSGTRWEAGLLMHSQHLQYKLVQMCSMHLNRNPEQRPNEILN